MGWLQLSLVVDQDQALLIEPLLESLGALSVTFGDAADEPVLEPPLGSTRLWTHTRITGLFSDSENAERLRSRIADVVDPALASRLQAQHIDDRAWEQAWMDDFHPMRFGKRLWIRPSGHRVDAARAVVLDLDPGLAFGTGTHPTTALCLEWLDGAQLQGLDALDFGCGSGVLAVAALKLGARLAIGVDRDPQALLASEDNARKNHVLERLQLHLPKALPKTRCDLVLANILAEPLIELAPRLARLTRPGGTLVLSGILQQQAAEVRAAYALDFVMTETREREGWVLLAARRLTEAGTSRTTHRRDD